VASATQPDGTGRKTFSLKTDVVLLEAKAKQIGDVRLIVIDPISAYMGGSDGNGNVETREVLEPLAEMANRLHIAVVAVTHLNKGGGGGSQNALNRFAGSIAFIAAARAAFAVIEDPEQEGRRLLLQVKNNLAPACKGLAFRMEQRLISDGIVSSNVTFDSEHVSQSVDAALTASEARGGDGSQSSGKQDVAEFLPTFWRLVPSTSLKSKNRPGWPDCSATTSVSVKANPSVRLAITSAFSISARVSGRDRATS
jgi:hypothetical protein